MAVGGLPADQLLQEAGVGPHPGSDGGHVGQRRGQGAVVPATQYTAHEENAEMRYKSQTQTKFCNRLCTMYERGVDQDHHNLS